MQRTLAENDDQGRDSFSRDPAPCGFGGRGARSHTVLCSPIVPHSPVLARVYSPIQSRCVPSHCCHYCCQRLLEVSRGPYAHRSDQIRNLFTTRATTTSGWPVSPPTKRVEHWIQIDVRWLCWLVDQKEAERADGIGPDVLYCGGS